MSRFSRYDTDEERLPEGMQRVGYDADTQVYTFRDADGSYWESAPGNEYGQLTKVGEARPEGQETETFLMTSQQQRPKMSWFTEMKPFLNFLMLVILSLVLLFWFLGYKGSSSDERIPIADCPEGTVAYAIHKGDTCWEIANKNGVSVDDLKDKNPDLNCEALKTNDRICVPGKKSVD